MICSLHDFFFNEFNIQDSSQLEILRKKDESNNLIFDSGDRPTISPIEISRQVFRGKNRCLVRILRQPELAPQAKEGPPELGRCQIRELSHAVNGRGVELLVPPRAAQVSSEDLEPAIVLLLGSVRLPESPLEYGEVVEVCQRLVLVAINHLPDQRILRAGECIRCRRGGCNAEDERQEEEETEPVIHCVVGASERSKGAAVFFAYI